MTMKHIYKLLAGILLLATTQMRATGGPDAYGYTWITSLDPGGPALNWIDITSRVGVQTVTGLADDNSAPGLASLGFNFHYYWNDVNQMRIGSNGWLSFNTSTSNIAACFPTIPTAGNGDNILAPMMGDLNFTGAGNPGVVKYWSNGLDSFIISYINVPFWNVSAPGWLGSNTFQVILCNSDSSITYQYGALSGFTNGAACVDLTVGIENSTGGIGLQVHTDAMPPSNYVIKFHYPNPVLLSIQDALPVWNTTTSNAAKFIFSTIAFPVTTDIRNGGNTGITSPITLSTNINDAVTFTNVYTASGTIPTLAAGDDSIYTYPTPWTPTVVGPYAMQTITTCSQDINAGNDALTTELDVVNPCNPTMVLSYVTGNAPSTSINWNGGANDDGVAVYYNPPVYPYTISAVQYYITSNVSNGYTAQIVDDDGPNGSPGTILFTTNVPSSSVVSAAWNTVNVTPTVTLPSGGFYVVWYQGGTNIFIGSETTSPQSHLNYEILDGSYATFRYDDSRDICIRASINGYTSAPTAAMTTSTNQLNLTTTNNSTGLITSYSWDFGDATSSTLTSPTHTYAAAGTYTVCLTATSPCTTSVTCSTINVCNTPTAAYTSTTSVLTANFTDMSTGTATTWMWDFGDATTSTVQNPSHTYAAGGTYTVCLIVGNACGDADTTCQTVSVCAPNTAAYMNMTTGLNATFMDMSTGAINTWSWDFGDATTSAVQSPTHTYASPGVYNVCLIVSNNCGYSDTTCTTVTVCNVGAAAFSSVSAEDSVLVSDMSTGGIMSWFWDFGDATTSSLQNPGVHHYATTGIYTICLVTTDSCGLMDTTCIQDTILITGYNINTAGVNSVYPNPASSEINVELWSNTNSTVEIYSATGELVYSQQVSGSKFTVDVKDFSTGMYTMRITNAGGSTVRRFVKE
jgi:PKD repeat protein